MFFFVKHLLPNIILLMNKKIHTFLQVFAIILDKVGQNLKTVKLMEVTFFPAERQGKCTFLERCQNGVKNRALT